MLKVISVYRGSFHENRGTPLRVKNLIQQLGSDDQIKIQTISADMDGVGDIPHFNLGTGKINRFKKFLNVIRNTDPDIVIGHTTNTFVFLIFSKFFLRKKVVLEMHGFIEEEERLFRNISRVEYLRVKLSNILLFISCDLITTCSETATKVISKYNKNTITLFGGVDTDLFNNKVVSQSFLKESATDIVIGYAGNTRKWQGLDFLLQTFEEVVSDCKRFKLALLLSEPLHNSQSRENVVVLPSVPHGEVPAFLSSCDILIIPRLRNRVNDLSFPSKLPEYLAMGKPVICSRTSDMHKIIEHQVNGLIFTPGNVSELKQCIYTLSQEDTRHKLGEGAHATIRENFTWEIQGKILAKALNDLMVQ